MSEEEVVLDENSVAIHIGENVAISDELKAQLMDLASELSGDEVSGYAALEGLGPRTDQGIRIRIRTQCAVDIIVKL